MATRLRKTMAGGFGALTALGVLLVTFTGGWEGKKNTAYRDIVGVWTICYGSTQGVKAGDHKTDAQCAALLGEDLEKHEIGMRKCLTAPDKLPEKVYAASLSLTFNIGIGAFCRSTVRRLLNAGDLAGACDAIPLFNRAGGKVVKGLVNRRAAERKLCMEGLNVRH